MKAIITNESKETILPDYINAFIRVMKDRDSYVSQVPIRSYLILESSDNDMELLYKNLLTLTNYANMVEMLEVVKKQYKVKLSKSYIIREAVYRKTLIDCIADITKVLEGKI
jgi:hypothetical protein